MKAKKRLKLLSFNLIPSGLMRLVIIWFPKILIKVQTICSFKWIKLLSLDSLYNIVEYLVVDFHGSQVSLLRV